MSIGPVISGYYMEIDKVHLGNSQYPSADAYNMIFLTGLLIAAVAIVLSLIIQRKSHRISTSTTIGSKGDLIVNKGFRTRRGSVTTARKNLVYNTNSIQ
jgi:hypothetical protein